MRQYRSVREITIELLCQLIAGRGRPLEDRLSSRAICGGFDPPARPENFCTTTLVLRQLVLQTHWETQDANVTFKCGSGPAAGTIGPARGRVCELPGPRLKTDEARK